MMFFLTASAACHWQSVPLSGHWMLLYGKNRRISVTYVLTKYTMALNLGKYEWSSQQNMDSITAVSQVASFLLTPITAFN